ncbi:MAG: hypothetical protein HYX46_10765 [Betaproteobacteria bacterium]|nr:hypothetical protein [Betaproteobacteria bacterium]
MSEERESNPLIERVDALLRRHQEDARRAEEEVPVLTEVAEGEDSGVALEAGAQALASEIEREVLKRVTPEIHDIVRRAVREAVLRAFVGRAQRDSDS